MNNKKFINISFRDLPYNSNVSLDDKLIIDTEDDLTVLPLNKLKISSQNTEFANKIDAISTYIQTAEERFGILLPTYVPRSKFKGAIAAYYSSYPPNNVDFTINNKINIPIPLNHISANALQTYQGSSASGVLLSNAIVIPKGTYKMRSACCFSIRNPGDYYELGGEYVGEAYGCNIVTDFVQYDSPRRTMLVSSIKNIPVIALDSKTTITSIIDGYFYICKTSQVGLRVSTDGNISIGDGSLNTSIVPKPQLINYANYYGVSWPVQLILELLNEEDIFNLGNIDLEN